MSTVAYKCPNCASPLVHDGEKMLCPACGTQFDTDVIEVMYAPQEKAEIDFETPKETYAAGDAAQMQAYHCNNCGAELITEGTTTATECPYCGSPAVLPDRIDGGIRPEKVVPFVIGKEQAQELFRDYFKGKALLPNIFRKNNQIAEMRRLFVPYWLFDCDAQGDVIYEAEKESKRREGEWEVTTTEHFIVRRAGSMRFEHIPVDGSEKLDDRISESLEPYDVSKAVDFSPAVLAGALADHADVDEKQCEARAIARVENSMISTLRGSVTGYTRVTERRRNISSTGGRVMPVLMPVWLITTVKDGKTYTFAINGQTGKLTCNVPTDKGKAFGIGAGVFAGVFGLGALILHLTKALGSGTLLMAGLLALFIALGTVFALIGKLRQAASQASAAGYVCEGGCDISIRYDRRLHTTVKRRKIENQAEKQENTQGGNM